MEKVTKYIYHALRPGLDDDKVLLAVNLFSEKLKEKLIAGKKVKFPRHFGSMMIIRVKKEVNFEKLNVNSSFEKYQLECLHPNMENGYVRFVFSSSCYASIQKYVSETNIKYKYVNK